jgi:hypothetical protein
MIRAGALGDCLLMVPALHALRAHFPQARIDVMGYPPRWEWVLGRGLVDSVHTIERPGMHLLFGRGLAVPEQLFILMDASVKALFVQDAFGSVHRAHASTAGITKHLPRAAAGYLMKKELDYLGQALGNPARPFVAVIGGSKISTKIDVIKTLLPRVDRLLLGGGMTYTFLKAQGLEVGKSIVENDKVDLARSLLAEAGEESVLLSLLRRAVPVRFLEQVAATPPWADRPSVLARVVLNPKSPRGLSLRLVSMLYWRDLADVAATPWVPGAVRVRCFQFILDLPRLAVGKLHVGAVVGLDDAVRDDTRHDQDADPGDQDDAAPTYAETGDAIEHGGRLAFGARM